MPNSKKGQQKRLVKQLIRAYNFTDSIRAETVFTADNAPILAMLKRRFGYVDVDAEKLYLRLISQHDRGDVLTDSRGNGTTEQVPPPQLYRYAIPRR